MAHPSPPPAETAGLGIDPPLKRTFVRILLIEAGTIGALYWMSQYFS